MRRKLAISLAALGSVLGLSIGTAMPASAANYNYAIHLGTRTTGTGSYTAFNTKVTYKAYYSATRKWVKHVVTLTDLNCDKKKSSFTVRGYTGYTLRYYAQYYLKTSCRSTATTTFYTTVKDRRYIYLTVGNVGGPWSTYKMYTYY